MRKLKLYFKKIQSSMSERLQDCEKQEMQYHRYLRPVFTSGYCSQSRVVSRNPLGFINDLHSLMTKTKCQFRSYIHRYIFLLSIVVTLEEKKKPAALKLAVNNRRAQLCDFLGGGRDAEQLNFFFHAHSKFNSHNRLKHHIFGTIFALI